MKKLLIVTFIFIISNKLFSQNVSVEQSLFGIEMGFLGVYFHNELKVTDALVFRSELGLNSAVFAAPFIIKKVGFVLFPSVSVEPRWYYNLEKRATKNLKTKGNSGNFISLKNTYVPDWFVLSNIKGAGVRENIAVIPNWGMRRTFKSNVFFETSFGLGYRFYFDAFDFIITKKGQVAANLQFLIGYRF